MSPRNWQHLSSWATEPCDLLVVGGGITGAGVARDAALRGLSTVLVEKRDFASGTSSKSGKLIHGGLRYLKHRHLRLVFSACRERAHLWRTVAPHLVRPVRFVVPCYATSRTPRWLLACGLAAYGLLALGRSPGRFQRLSRAALLSELPGLQQAGLLGGLAYWDCAALDFRLVLDTLKSAVAAGAQVFNYTELLSVRPAATGFAAELRNPCNEQTCVIRTKSVVNATGPWADDVQDRLDHSPRFGLRNTAGIHLVIARQRWPLTDTVALEVPADGRMIYAVPWGDTVLLGTTDTFYDQTCDSVAVPREAINYLLQAVRHYFPELRLSADDVLASFAGVRPLIGSDTGRSEDQLPRDDQILVRNDGIVSVTGGKLTTYRDMAQRVVDLVVQRCFADRPRSTADTLRPLLTGPAHPPAGAPPYLPRLWDCYGPAAADIQRLIAAHPGDRLTETIVPTAPYLWAEVAYALQAEFAQHVDDVVDRRLGLFLLAARPGERETIAAAIAARWPELVARFQPAERAL